MAHVTDVDVPFLTNITVTYSPPAIAVVALARSDDAVHDCATNCSTASELTAFGSDAPITPINLVAKLLTFTEFARTE